MAAVCEGRFAFVADVDFGYVGVLSVVLALDVFKVLFGEFGEFAGGEPASAGYDDDLFFTGFFGFAFFDAEADVDAAFEVGAEVDFSTVVDGVGEGVGSAD